MQERDINTKGLVACCPGKTCKRVILPSITQFVPPCPSTSKVSPLPHVVKSILTAPNAEGYAVVDVFSMTILAIGTGSNIAYIPEKLEEPFLTPHM